jgi:hypothetical protein
MRREDTDEPSPVPNAFTASLDPKARRVSRSLRVRMFRPPTSRGLTTPQGFQFPIERNVNLGLANIELLICVVTNDWRRPFLLTHLIAVCTRHFTMRPRRLASPFSRGTCA